MSVPMTLAHAMSTSTAPATANTERTATGMTMASP
jgi:hypothetical protein